MPDITTVSVSVSLTLAIQGTYFIFMKFPGQIHRCFGTLDRLKNKKNAADRIFQNVRTEIGATFDEFYDWIEKLAACQSREEGRLFDRTYFREVLPKLTRRLGRLQGLSTSLTSSYSTDPLPDFIWLYEQARRVSKNLASYQSISEMQLEFELLDIKLVYDRVFARREQMSHEVDILQADTHAEISNLEAEFIEMKNRFLAVCFFFGLLFGIATEYFTEIFLRRFGLQIITRSLFSAVSAGTAAFVLFLFLSKYYRYVVRTVPRIHLEEPETKPEVPITGKYD